MNEPLLFGIAGAVLVVVLLLVAAIKIVNEYERGVIFRLGRVMGAKGPGLFVIIPIVDKMVKVNLQTVTADIPPQDVITKDNVTLRVNAVTYFNVVDPVRSVVAVQNYLVATSQIAQTTLRSILGQVELDELLVNRDEINSQLQAIIDSVTNPWGVKVTLVEVKDVELPEMMRRAMGRQAEAERERRSKVIHAQGEREAAQALSDAAATLGHTPGAMQLRLLSTMSDVAAEKNSTLVFPVPVELLRFAEGMAAAARPGEGPVPPADPSGSSNAPLADPGLLSELVGGLAEGPEQSHEEHEDEEVAPGTFEDGEQDDEDLS